jgi:cell division protein YceG involved in septum cleavage
MAGDENKRSGLDIALSGVKGLTKALGLILITVAIIVIGHEAYQLGYSALYQVSVDEGDGRTIEVTVTDDMSVRDIGKMLQDKGLLNESPTVFVIQERISEYHGKILPGTYQLSTGMTADEMLRVMAGDDEDNPAVTTGSSSSDSTTEEENASAAEENEN